ncbi:MAG: hypothetical protein ACK56F_30000 [bacterium]
MSLINNEPLPINQHHSGHSLDAPLLLRLAASRINLVVFNKRPLFLNHMVVDSVRILVD